MDLIEQIEELQVLLEEAKAVPLSSSAVVNRDEVLDLLAGLKESVPDEVRQARWMQRDHQELLDRARRKAEAIVAEATEERERILAKTEIVAAAERRAEAIVEEASRRASRIQTEAEDYVDQKLASFEVLLDKTRATVSRGRERLRGENRSPEAARSERPVVFDAEESSEPLAT